MKKHFLFLWVVIGLFSCGKKEISTKKYYFPYASFTSPSVYKYVEKTDTNNIMYWYFETLISNKDTLFTTFVFNSKLRTTAIYQNAITAEGSTLKEMLVNLGDSTTMTRCKVKDNQVFLWKPKSGEKMIVSISIPNAAGEESENAMTERGFETKRQTMEFNGKSYECLVTKEVIMLNHIKPNRTVSEEQQRTSFFAEGIGLMAFETLNGDGSSTYFVLKKIITENEWKQMAPALLINPDSSSAATK